MKYIFLTVSVVFSVLSLTHAYAEKPTIEELKERPYLDDYYSNVVFGYNIVSDTPKYAGQYTGNKLSCKNCHLNNGTKKDALPLNVAGIYPQWRSKNGIRNGLLRRIRECFFYSLNGIMPSNDSPEVLAIAAYVNYLSEGEVIGKAPKGRGIPTLPATGYDPNPAQGSAIYQEKCAACHGVHGEGIDQSPPLWGPNAYNAGAGMNRIDKASGFIWANMPLGDEKSLTHQQAMDVAAYLNQQIRPPDPRKGKAFVLLDRILPNALKEKLLGQ